MRSRTPITLMGGICHAEDCRNTKTLTKSVQICLVYKTNPLFWFLSIFISVISVSMYCAHSSMSLIAKLVALHWKRISTGNGSDICHWVGSHIPPPENTNTTAPKKCKRKIHLLQSQKIQRRNIYLVIWFCRYLFSCWRIVWGFLKLSNFSYFSLCYMLEIGWKLDERNQYHGKHPFDFLALSCSTFLLQNLLHRAIIEFLMFIYFHTAIWLLSISKTKFWCLLNLLTTFRVLIQVKVILTSCYISNFQKCWSEKSIFLLERYLQASAELDIEKEICHIK